jgi:4-guanidinobutyraldehyde dehydrogenase/NAD-dependent aldehyde dehydrogenase
MAICFNQGEMCTAGSRLLVQRSIKDQFMPMLVEALKGWKVGHALDPQTQVGALVDQGHLNTVLSYIEAGHAEQAKLLCGGKRTLEETGGVYVEPTIFDEAHNQMRIAQEEIFGPVLTAIPFRDEAHAVELANGVQYGLSAYLWSNDLERTLRMTDRLDAGMIYVNSDNVRHLPTPFGGMKNSGVGRDGGDWSFEFYMEQVNVCLPTQTRQIPNLG